MSPQLRVIDLQDHVDQSDPALGGFLQAVARGFHAGRPKPEMADRWLALGRDDEATLIGAWLPDGEFGAGPIPIATYLGFDKTVNTGRGLTPVRMITDITVSPAHRRQGWLRRMITTDLADAASRGVPLATLTVSEQSIYGRFGFGPATHLYRIEIDSRRFALHTFVDPGRVEMIEPGEGWPVFSGVFAQFHERVRGSVDRPAFYRHLLTGELNFDFTAGNDKLRGAVHLDAANEPDGYVLFHVEDGETGGIAVVDDLVAASPATSLALWRFLADIDLVDTVRLRKAPVDDPLRWALSDAAAYRVTGAAGHIWLRVLDVPAALTARPWGDDGAAVLGIDDPLGHAAGRYEVTVREGVAEVAATERAADIELGADVLASLQLGGVGVRTLYAAGRLAGEPGAVERFARMADLPTAPYSVTSF